MTLDIPNIFHRLSLTGPAGSHVTVALQPNADGRYGLLVLFPAGIGFAIGSEPDLQTAIDRAAVEIAARHEEPPA